MIGLTATSSRATEHPQWLGDPTGTVLYLRGVPIWQQHDRTETMVQVVSGVVKLFRNWDTNRRILVGLRGPGSMLGLEQAAGGRPQPFQAVALTRCRVAVWSHSDVRAALATIPGAPAAVVDALWQNQTEILNTFQALADGTVKERLARCL